MTMLYKTAQVAKIIGIHPNTVRLYEEYGLITKPKRTPSGYRIYTDLHIEQFRLARAAMKVEVLQNGLRKQIIQILKSTAQGDFAQAIQLTKDYIARVQEEYANAEEALRLTKNLLAGIYEDIFRACDQLLTSLKNAEANARWMLQKLYEMEEKFGEANLQAPE